MVDKKDDANLVSIFDNLKLHAKPMDSFTKNGMDIKPDLEVHQKNGREKQKGKESIQQNSSSVQGRQQYFQQSQWTSKTNNIESEWGQDHYSNPIGCSLLPVHGQFMLLNENSKDKEKMQEILAETDEITLSTPRPNLSMDNYNGTQSRQATMHSQRFLESKPERYYQPCIWCINYGLRLERQGKVVRNPARERQIPSSSGSVWKCDSFTSRLGVWELLGDECLDLFMPVETRSPNQVSNNKSIGKKNNGTMQKLQSYSELVVTLKNDCKFRKFHGLTDERLIDQENREYFDKKYGITSIHPLLVDYSGTVLLFLDDRGIMFMWSESERGMRILGINKLEGLANYLYHPDKICAVMKDTGELVPKVELTRRVMEELENEKLEKKKLAEKNREKRLAKKKSLAEEKRLAKEKSLAEENQK